MTMMMMVKIIRNFNQQ